MRAVGNEEADCAPALIYIAYASGGSKILYRTTIKDAKIICSLDETRGKMFGGQWAYFWTSEANYIKNGGQLDKPQKGRRIKDDGRFEELFSGGDGRR